MYRVMIVDDEEWVRSGLIHRLNNIDLPVLFCAQAGSGQEAIWLVAQTRPDIILVDICMAGINGLELIREIKKTCSTTQFIIISGYEDFSFAKTAISLEVIDYVTKPIDGNRLYEALSRAIDKLDLALNRTSRLPIINQTDLSIIETGFNHVLHAPDGTENANSIIREILGTGSTAMILVFVGHFQKKIKKNENLVHDLIRLITIMPSDCFQVYPMRNFEHYNQLIILLHNHSDQLIASKARWWVQDLLNQISTQLHVFCTIAVCQDFTELSSAKQQYERLQTQLLRRNLDGIGRMYLPGENQISESAKDDDEWWFNSLKVYLDKQNEKKIFRLINELMSHENLKNKSASIIEKRYFMIADLISQHIAPKESLAEKTHLFTFLRSHSIYEMDDLEEAISALTTWTHETILSINDNQLSLHPERIISEVRQYIDTCYYEAIVRKTFCRKYNVSESYLSKLFRRYTGHSFTHYLNFVRLKKSIELLEQTDLSIGEIALSCGFNSHTYFCRLFKNNFGYTPLQYRERLNHITKTSDKPFLSN